MLQKRANTELLKMAEDCFRRDTLLDQTVMCLDIVVKRWKDNPGDSRRRSDAVTALRRLGIVYSTRCIDYRKAYDNLTQARKLAEEERDDEQLAYIYIGLSNLYNFNSSSNAELRAEARKYQVKAYHSAVRAGRGDLAATVGINLSLMAFSDDNISAFEPILSDALRRDVFPHDRSGMLSRKIVECALLFGRGEYGKAISGLEQAYKESHELSGTQPLAERDVHIIGGCLIDLYSGIGEYGKAISVARRNLELAREHGNRDFEVSSLSKLHALFKKSEQPDSADKYYSLYLKLKAEFSENQGYQKVEPLHMQGKINELKGRVNDLDEDRRLGVTFIVVLVLIIVIMLAAASVFMVRRKHEVRQTANPDGGGGGEEKQEEGSMLSKEELDRLKELYGQVENVMSISEEIYQPGFSLADLSAMVSATPRTVSKAISVTRDINFNQYLNEYRIRRAVYMIEAPEEANHTIQSIAERVGFRSRTHFTAIFKKVTGETPSEYWSKHHGRIDN